MQDQQYTGTVKWFNDYKGFGFIAPSDGSNDVFVHISAIERSGMNTLSKGDPISYDLQNKYGKHSACNLKGPRRIPKTPVRAGDYGRDDNFKVQESQTEDTDGRRTLALWGTA